MEDSQNKIFGPVSEKQVTKAIGPGGRRRY